MVVYLGVGPFLELVQASFLLKEATDRARTFAELEVAGEQFGRVLGREGTQVAILALAALLGQGMTGTSAGLASRLGMMPGFAEAAALGEVQVGLRLAAVGEVTSVAVVDGTLVVALPATAVAMAASGAGGIQGDPDGKVHHICTDKNDISDSSGGPWTPLFEKFFKKAGMSLNDPANQVRIRGHEGPHPEAYHTAVYERVREAVTGCRGASSCREALLEALKELSQELLTTGSKLRHLVTKGHGE
jgi:hypothetical protein